MKKYKTEVGQKKRQKYRPAPDDAEMQPWLPVRMIGMLEIRGSLLKSCV